MAEPARSVTAAVLIIGDEILSGRTRDINLQQIAEFLQPIGVAVAEARVVSDDQDAIIEAVNALRARYDYVFTTGGLGPTHDDITADALAAAFGVSIDIREDARAVLERWYAQTGTELTPARLRMARIPEGASLIENPVTGAPGFQLENVFALAGVPKIGRGMLEDVAHRLEGGVVTRSVSVTLEDAREGDIAARLDELAVEHPAVSLGSYPRLEEAEDGSLKRSLTLVARSSDPDAIARIEAELQALARDF